MGTYDELVKSEKEFSLLLASLSESSTEGEDGTGKVKYVPLFDFVAEIIMLDFFSPKLVLNYLIIYMYIYIYV